MQNNEKSVVYYTHNKCDENILNACRKQLKKCIGTMSLISVSQQPLDFGKNYVLNLKPSVLSMFEQILFGLKKCKTDIVFMAEHDILYHPSHFEFVPEKTNVYYYNTNIWKVRPSDGMAVNYTTCQVAALCAHKNILIEHYEKKVTRVKKEGFTRRMGFEPGNHPPPRGIDRYKIKTWQSEYPNIDIRHNKTLTARRFSLDKFRRKPKDWKVSDEIPGWGKTKGRFEKWISQIC